MIVLANLTADAASQMTCSALVKNYNAMADELSKPILKKFRDKNIAVARVLKLQNEYRNTMYNSDSVEYIDEPEPFSKSKPSDLNRVNNCPPASTKKFKSIKHAVLHYIDDDFEDKEIVHLIKQEFPNSKFNFDHISWYRSTLFRDGIIGPEHAPRRSKAYKTWLKGNTSP